MKQKRTEKRPIVSVVLFRPQHDIKMEGRFLGLLNDTQFASLIKHRKLQNKLYTSGSIPLTSLMGVGDLTGKRAVIALRKINDKNTSKQLFVTDKLVGVTKSNIDHFQIDTITEDWLSLREITTKEASSSK